MNRNEPEPVLHMDGRRRVERMQTVIVKINDRRGQDKFALSVATHCRRCIGKFDGDRKKQIQQLNSN